MRVLRNASSLKTYHMRIFDVLHDRDVVQLDIQILIHTLQRSAYRNVILEFDCDFMVDEGLEKAGSQ